MKSYQELKELHGKEYVEKFEKYQNPLQIYRLIKYVKLDIHFSVVDFGCGNGLLMECIAPLVKSYTGVDFSEPFIEAAERRKKRLMIDNAEFFFSSIEDFCNKNKEKFDIGFALDLSEHVYDKEWLKTLKKIRQSLKENGTLYLHTPNANFFLELMKNHSFLINQFPQHIAVRSPEENCSLLEKAGFQEIVLIPLPHYNILRFFHAFSYIPFWGRYFSARIFIIAVK